LQKSKNIRNGCGNDEEIFFSEFLLHGNDDFNDVIAIAVEREPVLKFFELFYEIAFSNAFNFSFF
jgi:hypothetical protein